MFKITPECQEELTAWFKGNCPCAFLDPARELYRGTLFIIEREVARHRARERGRIIKRLTKPGEQ